jgi:hypothetical protein
VFYFSECTVTAIEVVTHNNNMKLFLASLLVASVAANPFAPVSKNDAKTKYISTLIRGAKPIRKLEQDYPVDISGYSVKFQKCQFVKSYSDEMAENEDYGSVLATQRFAVFRLCPEGACSTCDYNYGEYLLDLDLYLQATVGYFQDYQQEMCNNCNECGQNQNQANRKLQQYAADCDTCYDECQKIENMEMNGYYDATDFLECKLIYDPEDDSLDELYAAPICASQGQKIKIGVFTDADCMLYDSTKDVDDYLKSDEGYQMKLSHALLKMTYQDTCISCKEPQDYDENNNGNDRYDADEVNELCEELYNYAAKCEASHGFDTGYSQVYGYENQAAQEQLVCDYIQSIKAGTYDEEGEINVKGANASIGGGSQTTGGQKFALTFFILGTVGLAVYAAMLHSKLTKSSS